MSEQLPDVYFDESELYISPYMFTAYRLPNDLHKIQYTPHSKLQEAEDIINELVLFRTECISCECKFHNDNMWHESNHKTYCTLAPYMRKRSTTNE